MIQSALESEEGHTRGWTESRGMRLIPLDWASSNPQFFKQFYWNLLIILVGVYRAE